MNNDSLPPPSVLLEMIKDLQDVNKKLTAENIALNFNLKQLLSLVDFLRANIKQSKFTSCFDKTMKNLIDFNTLTSTYYIGKNNPEKRP